jgi:hypothetical protein
MNKLVVQITIPEWINPELWEEFKEHRKLLGKNKELNHLSTKRILAKLLKFKDQGYEMVGHQFLLLEKWNNPKTKLEVVGQD